MLPPFLFLLLLLFLILKDDWFRLPLSFRQRARYAF